jgi:hypothetical protein
MNASRREGLAGNFDFTICESEVGMACMIFFLLAGAVGQSLIKVSPMDTTRFRRMSVLDAPT